MDSDTGCLAMNGIHIIPNFIDADSLKEIKQFLLNGLNNFLITLEKETNGSLNAIEVAKIKANNVSYGNNIIKLDHTEKSGNKELYDHVQNNISHDKKSIEKIFGELEPEDKFGITVMLTGSLVASHIDKQVFPQGLRTSNKMVLRDVTSVCYFNDDYEGGELCFDSLDMRIKPKAGTLVFFPTGEIYRHSVNRVTDGERYSVPKFWNFKSS